MGLLIKNARVINPGTNLDQNSDIYIEDGRILKVIPSKPDSLTTQALTDDEEGLIVIDAQGLVAAPGLIDIHVHFRDPGFTYKEDIFSGASAAVSGGYTTVILMANTKPAVDSPEVLDYIQTTAAGAAKITPLRIYSDACVSVGLKGQTLTDFDALAEAGAVGFTDDGIPLTDPYLLKEAFRRVAGLNLPISLHEEDPTYITENGINSNIAPKLHLTGSPRQAEISLIERDLKIANELYKNEKVAADVNIQHISTSEGVDLVRASRKINPHIHAEATPHHFTLTEEAVLTHNTLAKMNPPLRTEADRLAIIEGLKDGTIEIIATDHAPHSAEEKARDFPLAPSGIIGLETALPLGITSLVRPGHLSLMELIRKMTVGPADLYHLETGIEEGKPADLVLFDPDASYTVREFHSKSSNSPFLGSELFGVVHYTICGGEISFSR